MGYTTRFEGELKLNRPLTVREFRDIQDMNDDPKMCEHYTGTPDTIPEAYMQWIPNKYGEAIVWDGGEKFYNYIHWLRWLIKHYLKPRDLVLNGELTWRGEEMDDIGTLTVVDNKVTSRKGTVKGIVECPHCGERFMPDEK